MAPQVRVVNDRLSATPLPYPHLEPSPIFPGSRAMLAAAQLFVLSSRWIRENGRRLPGRDTEAAVAESRFITTRTCGASEIIEDRVTVGLCPWRTPEALAKAICESLGDRAAPRPCRGTPPEGPNEFTLATGLPGIREPVPA